jgi:hypothetical protein
MARGYPPGVARTVLAVALAANGALLLAGWWRLRTMPDSAPHTGPLRALLGLALVTLAGAIAIVILVPG